MHRENMIGIVIVSHSKKLAEGIRELAVQMTRDQVNIAIAAGIDAPDNSLGTDTSQIFQAIESVYSDDGVIVFMDLGSAILSTETAIDFFPDYQKENIYLCEAPLVEGVLSAVVQVAGGSNIDSVLTEARNALQAKASQLGIEDTKREESKGKWIFKESSQEIVLPVRNRLGLHARPAAKFVSTANKFSSEIFVKNLSKNTDFVNAKSINQIITLGVRHGHQIMIASSGIDAGDSILALKKLIESNFNEEEPEFISFPLKEEDEIQKPEQRADTLTGIPVSPGIAIGPVYIYRPHLPDIPEYVAPSPDIEITRFINAIDEVKKDIERLRQKSSTSMDRYDASIFEAHLLYLNDPALIERTRDIIFKEAINAEAAWQSVIEEMIISYKSLGDQLVRDREVDLLDISSQVISRLTGIRRMHPEPEETAILVVEELNPSEAAQLKKDKILALCSEKGNKTSHSAIMARSIGLPAVFGIGEKIEKIDKNSTLIVDGNQGIIIMNPDMETLTRYRKLRDKEIQEKKEAISRAFQKASTIDGTTVSVVANVANIADIKSALENGANGVGLFRTEYLYMNRLSLPSEEEQYRIYKEAADLLRNRPLTLRTLDIGGDKPIPYLNIKKEPNPFLGWRGLRYCLDEISIFKTQLRSILRASYQRNVQLMFPMVATVPEVRAAKAILAEVMKELSQDGIPFNQDIKIGVMIEIPSAVVMGPHLIKEVDFFSLGTNDLTQYVLAADRSNSNVVALCDPFDPAVLLMIRETIAAAHAAGKVAGMCGEMAGDLRALPILLGLGLDEFSMIPTVISEWKEKLRQTSLTRAKHLAEQVLQCTSVEEVKLRYAEYIKE
jgi:multiphosphoryl transfer protein